MITVSYIDAGDFNHFYSMLVDLETWDISAVYSPGGTPGSRYISLNEEEKWIVLMEIGHVMAADEQMIERPPLLIQRTRSLVFAERYRELIAAVKGEAFADAAAFRMFYEGLSGDGSKAAEAISEIESEIRRMQRDADGGKEVLDEAIGKVAAWAADAGIYDELQPVIDRLRKNAGATAHHLQTKAEALREDVRDWLEREARAENAGHLEKDAGNLEENISSRTGRFLGLSVLDDDDMNIPEVGRGVHFDGKSPTAVFLVIPDNDTTYNFIIGMFYTQLFQELYYQADFECRGGLPVSVEVWFDEFGNIALPDDFIQILSTERSRNVRT